jgi:hypothetical protein
MLYYKYYMSKKMLFVIQKYISFVLGLTLLNLFTSLGFGFLMEHIDNQASHKGVIFEDLESILFLLINILIFSLIEEIMFRLPINNNGSFKGVVLPSSFISLFFIYKFPSFLTLIIAISCIFFIFYFKKDILNIFSVIGPVYRVCISSFLFGVFHLFNYEWMCNINELSFAFIVVSSKFISGIYYSYAFLRFGIATSTLIHFLSNSILIFLLLM